LASHAYADNLGNNQKYTATLTLSDGGSSGTPKTFQVTVRDVPPTLTMGGPATVAEGGNYSLTLARSDRGTADILAPWNVNWGDGTTSTVSSIVSAST